MASYRRKHIRVTRRALSIADTSRADTRSLILGDSIYTCAEVRNTDSTTLFYTSQSIAEDEHAWGAYELPEILRRRDRERRLEVERMRRKGGRRRGEDGEDEEINSVDGGEAEGESDIEAAASRRRKGKGRALRRDPDIDSDSNDEGPSGRAQTRGRSDQLRPGPKPKQRRRSRAPSSGISERDEEDDEGAAEGEEDEEENQVFYRCSVDNFSDLPDSELLDAIHRYASAFYTSRKQFDPPPRKPGRGRIGAKAPVAMKRALDGSALLALGMLLEEHVKAEAQARSEDVEE